MSRVVARAVQAIVLAVFAAALAIASLVQNAEQTPATETRVEQHAEWTPELATRWPGCIDQDNYRGPDHFIPTVVLVQPFADPTAPIRSMGLDEALKRNDTPSPRDDMWIVASCRGDIR